LGPATAVLDGVAKSYGSVQALRGITFSLSPGITALVGPNGAGKTTALRILSTVLAPDAGTVEVSGLRVEGARTLREVRRRLGYMPQESGLYPWFRARDFLEYIAVLKDLPRAVLTREVNRVLTAVDLVSVQQKRIRSLSGGMRRRLLLAQALLGDPALVVLDEPSVGLDPEQRLRFIELLADIGERAALVLSTHQTESLGDIASKVVVIVDGRILFDGPPREFATRARGHVWLARERPPDAIAAIRTGDGSYRCIGSPPTAAHQLEPTIDDAYLLLTHRSS
jgi:ABC-2 type transport system ATP-binding protein